MKSNDRWKIKGMGRGGYRRVAGRKVGTRDGARTEVAEQIALTGRTPLEVMMEAMGHYQAAGNRDKAVAIAKMAAPYMHARLHAVAGTDGMSRPPVRDEQSLATIARKVALAFRIASQGKEAGLIEDAGDGLRSDLLKRLAAKPPRGVE
jgi:hypothetical protein